MSESDDLLAGSDATNSESDEMMITTENKKTIKCKLCNIILRHKSSLARGQCTALASCAKRRAANMTANGVKNAKSFLRNHSETSPSHVKEDPNEENPQHLVEQQSPDSAARNYVIGDVVEYHFCDTPNSWYPGVITKTSRNGDISIKFHDGDIYHDLPKYKRNASGISMVRHFSKESAPTLPRCIRCGQIFKNTRGLKIHRARGCRPRSANNSKCMIPRCITCGRVFKSLKGLRIHHGHGCSQKQNTSGISMELDIKKQKNTTSSILRCDTCGRIFETIRGLKIHRGHGCKIVHPENMFRDKKGKSANRLANPCKSGLKNIKKEESTDADILRCDTCDRIFETIKGLKIHQGRGCKIVSPENKVRVEKSKNADGLEDSCKSGLKNIKKKKSTDPDILRCDTCDRIFKTTKGLKVHRGHGCKFAVPENTRVEMKSHSSAKNRLEDSSSRRCGRVSKNETCQKIHRVRGRGNRSTRADPIVEAGDNQTQPSSHGKTSTSRIGKRTVIRPAKSVSALPGVKVGDLIFVAVRSWAGMNDEGGRAWVTKVNDDDTVDVRYVLRGKRQGVSLRDISKVVDTGQRPKRHSSSLQETKPKLASKTKLATKKPTPASKTISLATEKTMPATKKTASASKKSRSPDSRPKRPRPPSPEFIYTGDPPKYRRGDRVEARRPERDVGSNKTRFDYYFTHATVVKFLPRMSRRVHWYLLRFDSDKRELNVPESRDNFLHIRRITAPRHDVKVPRKKIAQLQALTELSATTAKALLVACKNDVEQASASFFDKQGSDSDDTHRAVEILVNIPRKRKRSKAKADTVVKSKKRPPMIVDIDKEGPQALVRSKRSKSISKRVIAKTHKMKTGPMGRSRPLPQAFLSTRIEKNASKHVKANTKLRRLSVRLKGVQHFVKFGIKSMEAQVMVRFGESCSTLSEPLVFHPDEHSQPLSPRKTVLSLKPLNDGSNDWGFTGTFKIAQEYFGRVKFVAVVGSAPSSLPDGIGFEKGGENNQWGVEPHVFLVRRKKNKVKHLIQINYVSSHTDDIHAKNDMHNESEDDSSSVSESPLPPPDVGEVVNVQTHEGPYWGMIDPGGRATVTKVNNDGTVDVRYNDRERERIPLHFISQIPRKEQRADSSDEVSAYDSSDSTPGHNRAGAGTGKKSRSINSHSSTSESESESDWEPDVGDLIFVLKRSWSGMVDEGGHAWVTKMNDDGTVDVRYVIDNRKRRNITFDFITPVDGEFSTRSQRRPSRSKSVAMPKRRARKKPKRESKKLSIAELRERQWQEKKEQRERWWERWWKRFPWDK